MRIAINPTDLTPMLDTIQTNVDNMLENIVTDADLSAATSSLSSLPVGGFISFLPYHGTTVQGSWAWSNDANATVALSPVGGSITGMFNSTGIGDKYSWAVSLPAGTYRMIAITQKQTNGSTVLYKYKTTTVMTVNNNGSAQNNVVSVADFTVSTDEVATVSLENSTAGYPYHQALMIRRLS